MAKNKIGMGVEWFQFCTFMVIAVFLGVLSYLSYAEKSRMESYVFFFMAIVFILASFFKFKQNKK
jgi:L-asparagine transporter-like permease